MNHDLTCLTNANKWYRELRHDHDHRIVIFFLLHAWFILQIFKTVTLHTTNSAVRHLCQLLLAKPKPIEMGMNRISYKLTASFFFNFNFFRWWWYRSYIVFFETRLRPQASCFSTSQHFLEMDYRCEVDKKKLFFFIRGGNQEKSIQVSARVFFYEYVYMYIYVVCIFHHLTHFFAGTKTVTRTTTQTRSRQQQQE